MHEHFENGFAIADLPLSGANRLAFRIPDDPGGGARTKVTPPAKPKPPTAAEKTQDAAKKSAADGHVTTKKEKTTFEKVDPKFVHSEEDRLKKALNGKIKTGSKSTTTPVAGGRGGYVAQGQDTRTDYGKKVDSLKDGRKLETIDKDIKARQDELKKYPKSAQSDDPTLKKLQDEKTKRAGDEQEVVQAVKDKKALLGTLEGDKHQQSTKIYDDLKKKYKDVTPEDVSDRAHFEQYISAKAMPFVGDFKKYDGQLYQGNDWFGDDWDSVDKNKSPEDTWKTMVDHVGGSDNKDKLDDWGNHQDSDHSDESKAAVGQLQDIMKVRNEYEARFDGIDSINTQQSDIKTSIKNDLGALSDETKYQKDGKTLKTDLDPDYDADAAAEAAAAKKDPGTDANQDPSKGGVDKTKDPKGTGDPKGGDKADPTDGKDGKGGKAGPDKSKPQDGGTEAPTSGDAAPTRDSIVKDHGGLSNSYTVSGKDSGGLSTIANQYNDQYHTKLTWNDIYAANRNVIGKDPNLILPGQDLNIPQAQQAIDQLLTDAQQKQQEAQQREAFIRAHAR